MRQTPMPEPKDKAATLTALKKRFGAAAAAATDWPSEPKVQKNLRLPESAAKQLAALARAEGLSQAALIVKALAAYAAQRKHPSE